MMKHLMSRFQDFEEITGCFQSFWATGSQSFGF
jgi:hypothetical protein